MITFVQIILGAALIGLGVLSLASGDFALNWQPVPKGLPLREALARLSGLLLLSGGIALLLKRYAARAAFLLACYWLLCAILMHLTRAVQHPLDIGLWLGCAENLLIVCGAYVLFRSLAGLTPAFPTWTRVVLGLSCIICGLSHFRYAGFTADMVPAWLPGHMFFALATGTGHILAGLAIMAGVLPRLAATLEAAMISSFVLLIHLPGVLQVPLGRMQWTMLFIASVMAAAVWAVAASFETASRAETRVKSSPVPAAFSAQESPGLN